MNKKYFVIGDRTESSKEAIGEIQEFRAGVILDAGLNKEAVNNKKIAQRFTIKAPEGRVILLVDLDGKNFHQFSFGLKIRLERDYNNLDVKHTRQTMGIVVSAKSIPVGSSVLFHPNATHETYRINNLEGLSGESESASVGLFSISEEQVYLWKDESGDWKPTYGFATGLRVFEPYRGIIEGIPPTQIKNTMYMLDGELKGMCVLVLKAADYPIIFNDTDGKERTIIRCRHFEKKSHDREEVVGCNNILTERINRGELLIGIDASTAKKKE